MKEKKIYTLIIESDFKNLCPKTTESEYSDMEKEIVYQGCPHSIEVWNDIILYDFIYYDICRKWKIPFNIKEMHFQTRNDALFYSCQTILKTQPLSEIYYRYVIGKAFQAMKKIMSDVSGGKRLCPFPQPDFKTYNNTKHSPSAIIAAEIFHISPSSISRYCSYAAALETLADRIPAVAEAIFSNELSFSIAKTIDLAKRSTAEILLECERQRPSTEMPHARLNLQQKYCLPEKQTKCLKNPGIKQMPKYDPDAEISSLTLTIPTWIGSMERTQTIADFKAVSPAAIARLSSKLSELSCAVENLSEKIKESQT